MKIYLKILLFTTLQSQLLGQNYNHKTIEKWNRTILRTYYDSGKLKEKDIRYKNRPIRKLVFWNESGNKKTRKRIKELGNRKRKILTFRENGKITFKRKIVEIGFDD